MNALNRLLGLAALVPALLLAGCAGESDGILAPEAETSGPSAATAAALVGTWVGTVDGSLGPGGVTIRLKADSTMIAQGTGAYCRLEGRWTLSGSQFSAQGRDCDGTVALEATASSDRMAGNWSASGGNQGTFSVRKQ